MNGQTSGTDNASTPQGQEGGTRAKSMTITNQGAPRPTTPAMPPPSAASALARPKSVVIPGANVNTLRMKALFEGGSPAATHPPVSSSALSSSASTSSSPSPQSPARPISASGPLPATPVSTTTTAPSTAAPVNRMKSFFEEKAREQDAGRNITEQKKKEMAKLQEERMMKDRVEREFFDTEENYFKSLDIVVEVYVKPLREAKIVSQQDMDTIFSNIETIHQIHQRLYLDLKPLFCPDAETPATDVTSPTPLAKSSSTLDASAKAGSKPPQKSLGDLLRAFIPFFKMYTVYINSFDNANKRVSDLQSSSKKFSQFLTDCKDRPECKKLDLVSFLIMPIQRLPRYELLLRDILRHTSDASEHAKIEQVFNTVADVNKHVNSEKGASILRARLYKLKAAVKHRVDIFSRPDRRLVREGDASVRKVESRASEGSRLDLPLSSRNKSEKNVSSERRTTMASIEMDFLGLQKRDFKPQYFFLFDDFLLQVVKKSKSDKFTFRCMYNLRNVTVHSVQQSIQTPSSERVKSQDLSSSSSMSAIPVTVTSPSGISSSGNHLLPTRTASSKALSPSQDLTMEGMQNGETQSDGEENGSEGPALTFEHEGEIVDDLDADQILLLVDNKTKESIHIKFKSRLEKEDWIELIEKGREEMIKLGLEGPKDLKEEALAEKKAREEKEREEKEQKRLQLEKEKKEKEAKMAQLQAQKEKENAMYKYDHMFKGIILPSVNPKLKDQADEILSSLVDFLADKDISELGAKMPFRLRTVRARNLIVKLQLWLQKPNDSPTGIQESSLRSGLHVLLVAYDATSKESLAQALAWAREVKKLALSCVLALLAFQPAAGGEAVAKEAGQQAANEEGLLFFDAGKVTAAEEDSLDTPFETVVERILDVKGPMSPDSDSRRGVDVTGADTGKEKKKKFKGILNIGKKATALHRKTSNVTSNSDGSESPGKQSNSNSKKESRG